MPLLYIIWPCTNTSQKQVLWLQERQKHQPHLGVLTVTSTLIVQRQEREESEEWDVWSAIADKSSYEPATTIKPAAGSHLKGDKF